MATRNKTLEYLTTTKIGEQGQLTVPKQFHEDLGLATGARFAMLRPGDGLVLLPEQQRFESLGGQIGSALTRAGLTAEVVLATLPEARKRISRSSKNYPGVGISNMPSRRIYRQLSARGVWLCLLVWCFVAPAFAEPATLTPSQDSQADFAVAAQAASSARDAGRTEVAIENYRRAVAIRPDWQEGWFFLGTLQYDTDRYADAIPAFQKLTELAPTAGPAWNFLGLCEFETKDYANATAHLEKGQQLGTGDDPEIARVSKYHLALLLNREGDFDRATTTLRSAFGEGQIPAQAKLALGLALLHAPVLPDELDPSQEALVRSAGEIAARLARGDSATALHDFPQILMEHPGTPYLHDSYAKALAAAGNDQEAQEQRREESRIARNFAPEKAPQNELMARIYARRSSPAEAVPPNPDNLWNQAMGDYSSEKYSDAIAHLKIWIERRPAERQINDGTAWAVMGLSEFALKDYDNALIHLQRGQDLGLGGSAESVRLARYHLGILLDRSGQYESAAGLLAPEANHETLASEIRFALGIALLRMPLLSDQIPAQQRTLVQRAGEIAILLQGSKYAEAFPKLQLLLKEYPNTPFLHFTYGLALASLSQYDEATLPLREEVRISPASELPYLLLASIALRQHHPTDALASAEHAIQLAPQSAKAHYTLGRAYLDLGEEEKALRELEAANKINPGSPEIHFILAKAYAKAKLPDQAQQERATFVRLNALVEQQRSLIGNQSYGASTNSMELSPAQAPAPNSNSPEQP
jgi:tetratricopeptide (TPR) repeat protein/bifunctional DNA-binding transcriptional regulator/antitoxin component of YhaV-PrlF toxin-antitoxin module